MIILIFGWLYRIIARTRAVWSRRAISRKRTSAAMESTRRSILDGEASASEKRLDQEDAQPHQNPTSGISTKRKKKKKAKKSTIPAVRHGMITRSRVREFRLLDLPPEIRNRVYSFAVSSQEPLSLAKVKLAPEMSLSRQLRSETLPILFATNTFTSTIRSNWCVYNAHFHGTEHVNYKKTGSVELSPLLAGSRRAVRGLNKLPDQIVRFQHLHFRIDCCCCADAKEIGSLNLSIAKHKVAVDWKVNTIDDLITEASLMVMFLEVKMLAERIQRRPMFNGFTVEDVKEVASCFRYLGRKKHGLDGAR